DRGSNSLEHHGILVAGARDEDHAVLFAAVPADEVHFRHVAPDRLRDERDDSVPGAMTESVVDALEVIDVDHRAAQRLLLDPRRLERTSERIEERTSIQTAGERIVRSQV